MTIRHTINPDADLSGAVPAIENSSHNARTMAKILQEGNSSQRTLILFEMPQLLANCRQETLSILVPTICLFVEKWDEDVQIAAAEALLDVVQQSCPTRTKGIIVQAALSVVKDSESEDLLESWGEILVMILPTTNLENGPKVTYITDILNWFARSELSVHRKLASRVFGAIAPSLTAESVEARILDNALMLVDDPDPEIRGMTAESMAFIGAVTSEATTEVRVWPKIWSLLSDRDVRIRAVTLRTIAFILDGHRKRGLSVQKISKLLHPVLVRKASFAHKAALEDQRIIDNDTFLTLETVSEVFGQLLYSCSPHIEDDKEAELIFETFHAMATCNSPAVRRFCAFNLPGVCVCLSSKHNFELSQIAQALSIDMDSETRCNLAAGIHETIQTLVCDNTVDCLLVTVLTLIRDENPVVRMNVLQNFFVFLSAFCTVLGKSAMDRLAPLFERLMFLEEGNWRTQEALANQLQDVVRIVPAETLCKYILPLLYRLAENSTSVVRKSAMRGIAKALWHIPIPSARDDAMQTFRIEWGEGGIYWMRTAFIDCAEAATEYYSKKLFNRLFLDTLLYLTDDPVPNVRLRLGRLIPKIAPFCPTTQSLNRVIDALKVDSDPDVRDLMVDIELKLEIAEHIRESFGEESERREHAETQMMENAKKLTVETETSKVPEICHMSTASADEHPPQEVEPCTPDASGVIESELGFVQENLEIYLGEGDVQDDEEDIVSRTSPPENSKKGLKSLRIHLGSGNEREENENMKNSIPMILVSPINSPEAGKAEEHTAVEERSVKSTLSRQRGLQILRDLGWNRKRLDR